MMTISNINIKCHVCGTEPIKPIRAYYKIDTVTSDCKPWRDPCVLSVCHSCGCAQKAITDGWKNSCDEIYASYDMYQQSGGVEPAVFAGSATCLRSTRIVNKLIDHAKLSPTGRLLDIGCGNGALLRAFSAVRPQWTMAATELTEKYREKIECINGVECLYNCPPDEVPGEFDVVSLVHVLEHVLDPVTFLSAVRKKMKPGSWLMIESPDYTRNPFDLVIYDHCTHFSAITMRSLLFRCGFETVVATNEWIPKELTVIARASREPSSVFPPPAPYFRKPAEKLSDWLWFTSREASALACRYDSFGIFGSSIGGSWLASELRLAFSFFVDEDPNRAGKEHLGKIILAPQDVPDQSGVFIPLPPSIADNICSRCSREKVSYFKPPVLPI